MIPKSLLRNFLFPLRRNLQIQNPTQKSLSSATKFFSSESKAIIYNLDISSGAKETVDCVVIGAGIVGIAIARELAFKGREVLVLDSAPTFGTVTSSRNSEVIHAGIYHPSNWFKARLCVKGREMLYKYCSERHVPHKQLGKLIVATQESEVPKLNELLARGIGNGVNGLRLMDATEAMNIEPELQCVKALFSPLSGIVDTHALMFSLLGEAEGNGATFSYNTTVLGGNIEGNQIELFVTGSQNLYDRNEGDWLQAELRLLPKIVINSAGLAAVPLAKRLMGVDSSFIPSAHYARGHYFSLSNMKVPPFRHLIYPLPEEGGIGVHVTLDLDGRVKFGPDVEWIGGVDDVHSFLNRFDYSVCLDRNRKFYSEIRKYYPQLKDGALEPGYAGIRPKLSGPGTPPTDFVIQGQEIHGVYGLVNLFGIESPGVTASMAIAEHVSSRVLPTM
ncbi:L-2-hydroxyglutarate dehydrogenase, mitochondrial isoform X2 [Amaranthus tricolor]|uniref:L-2-hydroxyglutarate dehydrogenase, mitochondrial isoform X2 n=1 Tax=Amaranthus tricolor TaxID=29722 RepID=UPI002590BA8E|nr:L-2-hydroxyglutarate dehydrogenase, mitochondrial isoform X2 [Amaranthus tricolor]